MITPGGKPSTLEGGKARAIFVKDPSGFYVEVVQRNEPIPANAPAGNVIGARLAITVKDTDETLRFYREYFKPAEERTIEKDRRRWLVEYEGDEFFVNLDRVLQPELPGFYLEIKARTWSRSDAETKASVITQLLELLAAGAARTIKEEYVEFAR